MAQKLSKQNVTSSNTEGSQPSAQMPWFVGGLLLSLLFLCSVALLAMFLVSAAANAYLTWEMSGMEVVVKVPPPAEDQVYQASSSSGPITVVAAVTSVAPVAESATLTLPEPAQPLQQDGLPEPTPTTMTQPTTASQPADATGSDIAQIPPTPTNAAVAPATPEAAADEAISPETEANPETFEEAIRSSAAVAAATPETEPTPYVSTNTYELIPLEGERDSRAAPEHADLSLNLRQPEPSDVKKALVDLAGTTDSQSPNLLELFEPKIVGVYAIHEWDWSTNRTGSIQDGGVLIEVATTPGEAIYIPRKNQDIYQGKYYATLLYATEDSITFVYLRKGNVAEGYSVQYQGLQVDPNLLKLYRESKGNQLPGLTLDTPVGIATGKLLIAMRDRGRYMDTRSRKDWWK